MGVRPPLHRLAALGEVVPLGAPHRRRQLLVRQPGEGVGQHEAAEPSDHALRPPAPSRSTVTPAGSGCGGRNRTAVSNMREQRRHGGSDVSAKTGLPRASLPGGRTPGSPSTCRAPKGRSRGCGSTSPASRRRRPPSAAAAAADVLDMRERVVAGCAGRRCGRPSPAPGSPRRSRAERPRSRRPSAAPTNPATPGPDRARGARAAARRRWPAAPHRRSAPPRPPRAASSTDREADEVVRTDAVYLSSHIRASSTDVREVEPRATRPPSSSASGTARRVDRQHRPSEPIAMSGSTTRSARCAGTPTEIGRCRGRPPRAGSLSRGLRVSGHARRRAARQRGQPRSRSAGSFRNGCAPPGPRAPDHVSPTCHRRSRPNSATAGSTRV